MSQRYLFKYREKTLFIGDPKTKAMSISDNELHVILKYAGRHLPLVIPSSVYLKDKAKATLIIPILPEEFLL